MLEDVDLDDRARAFAALGDPSRLRIVDLLRHSDLSPSDIVRRLDLETNLIAHHLRVLEEAGLVRRVTSSGDGRRRYVCLIDEALSTLLVETTPFRARRVLFVCTRNSARSQLASAVWNSRDIGRAESAGTRPAERVHPGAVAAAARAGLDLDDVVPRHVSEVRGRPDIVITVCDEAREDLEHDIHWLHWSIPDPVRTGRATHFDGVVREVNRRIDRLGWSIEQKDRIAW